MNKINVKHGDMVRVWTKPQLTPDAVVCLEVYDASIENGERVCMTPDQAQAVAAALLEAVEEVRK